MSDWLDAEAHADRALEMFERGRWAEAEAELRKALSLNPDQPEWHFNLGLTLEAAQRDSEALASYVRAIELMPREPEPLVAAGHVANRLGRPERSIEWFEQAIRLSPFCEAAYAGQIDGYVRMGRHDEAEMVFYMSQQALEEPSAHCLASIAESLIERKEYARAGWCLREGLRIAPNMPRLRARLGTVLAASGEPQKAMHMFLRDLRDDPGNIDTLLDFGELLVDLGRLPEGAEKFRRVLELEPANVDAHANLGRIALRARRWEQAHLEFELVLKLDPTYPNIRLHLAEALLGRGRRAAARRMLVDEIDRFRGAEGAPDDELDLDRFGQLLLDVGEPAHAADVLVAALEREGETAARLRRLALARFRAGDRDAGVAASRRVLRYDRGCLSSIHNLALAALEDGRPRAAAAWIQRGLRLDRHDSGLRRLRMRVLVLAVKRLLAR